MVSLFVARPSGLGPGLTRCFTAVAPAPTLVSGVTRVV